MQAAPRELFSYRKHWASRFGTAPFLPMSKAEMDALGWDSCDIIVVTGDAYVDHPSFGMAIIGRVLEAQGFRVGIIAQPDWRSADDFARLGKPNLFFGITAGNMDSMVNRYTSDRRIRSDDAYTPGGQGGRRPDRSVIVYAQRVREAFNDVPIVVGGIEASLRRIAHFDYWSEKVRRSILLDAKADLLVYGNAERQIVEIAHRLAKGTPIDQITDLRGTAFVRQATPEGWTEIDSTTIDDTRPVESADRSVRGERCEVAGGDGGCESETLTPEGGPSSPLPVGEVARSAGEGPPCSSQQGGKPVTRVVKFYRQVPNLGSCADRDSPAVVRSGARRSSAVRACFAHPASRNESRQRSRAGAASRRTSTCGSIRRRCRWRRKKWMRSTNCRTSAYRIRSMASRTARRRKFPPTR